VKNSRRDGAGAAERRRERERKGHTRVGERRGRRRAVPSDAITKQLTREQRALLGDLFAVIEEHSAFSTEPVDRKSIERAFAFACESHADQQRRSGEDFITHPLGVARICAGMRLDTETLCAALLHDTVEDTSASLEEVHEQFGEEVAQLVDGVTKLTGITFRSRDEHQAENYRKMMVAMATDVRVILIKLADRLHNMRTVAALSRQKQQEKARETLEIFAPLAHRLGIHAIKWELEDLAFQTLHPRKYDEIKELVAQQRAERERYVENAGRFLAKELKKVGIEAEISGRAKNFYSIYTKMTHKGREFNEIFDLTAMRVIVGSVKDCYGAIGIIHSIWKPLPGRFKDFVAMPKANMYQALHTTVIGPEGQPLEIQIRTPDMHDLAEYGIAAHVLYKEGSPGGDPQREKMTWLRQLLEAEKEQDPKEFLEALKVDLFEDEVFVFTPKGEVKNLSAGSTPLDFAYAVHTDVGHRCVGAKVNGKIVPLHYQLRSGDIVEVLTAKQGRGPSRDWLKLVRTSRARNKIRAWFKSQRREDAERDGRESLQDALRKRGLPHQRIAGSPLFADVIREMGFRKADDFYIALGQSKISTKVVAKKLM
jgi:guanosine-3',5'-bis(diphosphate) 3'-pyrophosphohydrolase